MAFTLVVLAAGRGSRYGGLKQIDPVGPSGETVLDYAVYDARRAGFTRVVFVIRKDFEALFREKIGARYTGRIEVDYVFQSLDGMPPGFIRPGGREKPWGTGHATWCARHLLTENFAVINADDFYGADSFVKLTEFLRAAPDEEMAMVGFKLARTLSEHGAVSRGVCAVDRDGGLQSIVEQTSIIREEVGAGRRFSGAEFVSMNCWGFTPAVFARLDGQFREFLASLGAGAVAPAPVSASSGTATPPPDPLKAEYYLPTAVSTMIARGEARVRILPTESSWFGVTYREDGPRVRAALAELVRAGSYPSRLWS
ncbi:MAG: nucleotidyltransferase [Opitutus sp.]|nr:nucleotidyltransferase [Opitutus sp.]